MRGADRLIWPATYRERRIVLGTFENDNPLSKKKPLPLVAIVGRPNVGKSTLFNHLTGSRRAIVGDEPGITRDRLYGEVEWLGHEFRVVDTGGIIPDDKDFIPSEIFRQARVAFEEASAIVMVVDARTEIAGPDRELARLLARTGKPLFLAVNKMDSDKQDSLLGEFHSLGMRNIFPISAEHGRGVDDLLDAILLVLPASAKATTRGTEITEEGTGEPSAEEPHEIKVAIIGHPNVGKSTLLNQLTGVDRAIVSPAALGAKVRFARLTLAETWSTAKLPVSVTWFELLSTSVS